MKSKIGIILTGIVLAFICFSPIAFGIGAWIFDTYLEYVKFTQYLRFAYLALSQLVIAILIIVEINNLKEFHIDKFTLATFILTSFLRKRLGVDGEEYLFWFIALIGMTVIIALIRYKPKLPSTNIRWSLSGIAVGIVVSLVLFLVELLIREPWQPEPILSNSYFLTVLNQIAQALSYVPFEEIIFRGFLWGYLSRQGLKEGKIIWMQGLLFWLAHLHRVFTPFTFFAAIPILTIISSQLTRRSKQVFPATLCHMVINMISVVLNLATY